MQRSILYDVRIKPRNIATTTGSKDLQTVSLTLRVMRWVGRTQASAARLAEPLFACSRPDVSKLPQIYRSLGQDYDERVLPSIGNEVLKAIVAQFDAAGERSRLSRSGLSAHWRYPQN